MYVLVHGAGMGASCWDRLIPHLDAPAVAIDLSRARLPQQRPDRVGDARGLRRRAARDPGETSRRRHRDRGPLLRRRHRSSRHGGIRTEASARGLPVRGRPPGRVECPRPDRPLGARSRSRLDHRRHLLAGTPGRTDDAVQRPRPGSHPNGPSTRWSTTPRPCSPRRWISPASRPRSRVPTSGLTKDACYPPELQERSVAIVGGDVAYLDTGHMSMVAAPERLAQTLRELR